MEQPFGRSTCMACVGCPGASASPGFCGHIFLVGAYPFSRGVGLNASIKKGAGSIETCGQSRGEPSRAEKMRARKKLRMHVRSTITAVS